ncbi:MAG TPA: GxxExxY protein [Bacteroidales bacterium]|nr:GxxExxY protein [Bacteroidales bacterium]HPI87093.1 GxxExxY protein [Bacteroidales bacterium]
MTQKYLDGLTYQVIGAAIEVHKELGPGLLESVYEKCLVQVIKEKGLKVSFQQKVPVIFHGIYLECELRYDIMVEETIIVEIKAVEVLLPIHEAQLLTYLKLTQKPKGILLNFNCVNIFKEGQKTLVTELFSKLPKS